AWPSGYQGRSRERRPARAAAPAGVEVLPVGLPALGRAHAVDRDRPADRGRARRVEPHRRLLAVLHLTDRRQEHAPVGDDRLIAVAEMLARAVLDAALALDRPLIMDVDVEAHAGEGLRRLFGDVVAVLIVPAQPRAIVGKLVELQPRLAHLLVIDRRAETGEDRVPVAGLVVDRHVPLRDR